METDSDRNTRSLTGEIQPVTVLVIPRDDGSMVVVHPDILYTSDEVRRALRFERLDSIYEIPRSDLPYRGIGLKRKQRRYWGRDVIAYVEAGAPDAIQALRTG